MFKRILFFLILIVAGCETVPAQDMTDDNTIAFEVARTVTLNGATAVTTNFNFAKNWRPGRASSSTVEKGLYNTSGFYNTWLKCDTTAAGNSVGGTDSLRIVAYPLNFDGSLGTQDSTVVDAAFDFTVETWEGPFNFTQDNVAGYAIKLSQVAADTCVCDIVGWK